MKIKFRRRARYWLKDNWIWIPVPFMAIFTVLAVYLNWSVGGFDAYIAKFQDPTFREGCFTGLMIAFLIYQLHDWPTKKKAEARYKEIREEAAKLKVQS